jgi:putative tricarboxylic transport membrane protein
MREKVFMGQNNPEVTRKNTVRNIKSLPGPILIFFLGLFFFVLAGTLDENPMEGQLGPFFWPKSILILLMLSCGFKVLESFKGFGKGVADTGLEGPPIQVQTGKLVAMIVMLLGAVACMEMIGFALCNFLFLLLFMRVAGLKKKSYLLILSGLGTILLLYIFVKVVYLPLPKGRWFFTDVTIFLYRFLHII